MQLSNSPMILRLLCACLLVTFVALSGACGDEEPKRSNNAGGDDVGKTTEDVEDEDDERTIAIVGTWKTNYNSTETITASRWGLEDIVEFKNAERWVITVNTAATESANQGTEGRYNKIVWTQPRHGSFHYCWTEIGRLTLDQVKAGNKEVDESNLATGCLGENWKKLEAL
ncbi:MAG: hypothetical protein H0U74_13270 [Bradymonadaceae bacterium]|nr:hypothetical protein [Lujinxingiaceae bacterium]